MDSHHNEQSSNVDMTIYKNLHSNECVITDHANNTNYNFIQNCDYMKRITIAMKYYQSFSNNKIEKEVFINFCEAVYTNFLDDYIHFMSVHNYHLTSIANELQRAYGVTQCTIDSCDIIGRHYRMNTRTDETGSDDDETDSFYKDSFDRIHHQIFHLKDLGFRDNIKDKKGDKEAKEVDMSGDVSSFDDEFMKLKERIFKKRDAFLSNRSIDRFGNENNKFNLISKDSNNGSNHSSGLSFAVEIGKIYKICIENEIKTELTFLDGLFIDISEQGNVDQGTIKLIIQFMRTHQFDTDSFKDDINTNNDDRQSNLYNISNQNTQFMSISNRFITNTDCMFLHTVQLYVKHILCNK